MFVLETIPLSKIPLGRAQILSYFLKSVLPRGALVVVPLGQRAVRAIVVDSSSLENKKMAIRKGAFELKPISKIICEKPLLTDNQFKLAKYLAQNYVSPLGVVLKLFVPDIFLKRKTLFKNLPEISLALKQGPPAKKPQFLWADNPAPFYFQKLKQKMRQRMGTVLFLVPNLEELAYWENHLKEVFGEEKIIIYHKGLKSKEKLSRWLECTSDRAKIILGTKSALFMPFRELALVIIEKENDVAFTPFGQSPCYDARESALMLAQLHRAEVLLSSSLPSVESYRFLKSGDYLLTMPMDKTESYKGAGVKIIDLKKEVLKKDQILSPGLKVQVESALNNQGRVLLFVNRKGFGRALECKDCGFIFNCPGCDSPMIYHLLKGPVMLCHHCGAQKAVPETCPVCLGNRIESLGLGTQKAAQYVMDLFPKANILKLDTDFTPSYSLQRNVIQAFLEKSPCVLVATSLILKFQKKLLAQESSALISAILSAESLLFFPEYRTRQRFFEIVKFLQEISQEVFIQTYNPDLDFFKYFDKNSEDFMKDELELRKEFGYPPFSELIRLTFNHTVEDTAESQAAKISAKLKAAFKSEVEILGPLPGFIPKVKGKYLWHLVIKCKRPCQKIKSRLSEFLTPRWEIEVNPENLL